MIKLRVINSFHDCSNFAIIHQVGDIIEVDNKRADKLITLGLCELIKPNKKRV